MVVTLRHVLYIEIPGEIMLILRFKILITLFGLRIMMLAIMIFNDDDDDDDNFSGSTSFVSEIATVTNICSWYFHPTAMVMTMMTMMLLMIDDNDNEEED